MATITPDAPALTGLITKIKTADPSLGIKKVLSEIQSQEPTWLVSEKRVKKLMAEAGIATANAEPEAELDPSIPVSHIDKDVDISTLTKGLVTARMINRVIGKGNVCNGGHGNAVNCHPSIMMLTKILLLVNRNIRSLCHSGPCKGHGCVHRISLHLLSSNEEIQHGHQGRGLWPLRSYNQNWRASRLCLP